MKTRIIKTIFWRKVNKKKLSKDARLLYIYLITSEYVNLCGVFPLDDDYIMLDTKLTPKELETAKQELHDQRIILFYQGWVYIVNATEHNNYKGSPKTMIAYERELNEVAHEVMQFFDTTMDTSIDTGTDTTMPKINSAVSQEENTSMDTTINTSSDSRPKSEYLNKKTENLNKGGVGEKFLEVWNETFKTAYRSPKQFQSNLEYWLTIYPLEDILKAVAVVPKHDFWGSRNMTPELFLRRRNPSGEPVDRIGEMLNYRPKGSFQAEKQDKYTGL